jgi:kynurenine 3-monooxygenase
MRDKVADPAFLRLREIEHELQDRMPGRYLSRYQLVTFTRVPFRVALQAGRIQQEILEGLARGDYGLARAEELVAERLAPLIP